jgi:circadian clock protein KaiC
LDQLKRLKSGIDGLDILLKGGFVAGASYIIQGRPGSGKTILANQLGFNHVQSGGRVLFATLLAEPHDRLFHFLSTLSFFDKSQVGQSIQFVSAFDTLENEGLEAVVKLLRREISRQKSTVLILDGLLNARSKAESPIDTKKFISELQGHAAFAGCTVLFLTSSQLDDGSPEHTMVDGVIEMGEENVDSKSVRRIKLRKTRGSSSLPGSHEFEITDRGITVYPRLEAVLSCPALSDSDFLLRVGSGIETLDKFIGGGLVGSSITLIAGPTGVGKTSVGMEFLNECTAEEPGLYFGFYESPQRIRLKASAIGLNFSEKEQDGALHIVWNSTTGGSIDRLGFELLDIVETKQIKRVFLDSLGGMARLAADKSRTSDFFTSLMGELRARNVTVIATWEIPKFYSGEVNTPTSDLSSIFDNLLFVRFEQNGLELRRLLSILKIRDSGYDPSLLELVISDSGLTVRKVDSCDGQFNRSQ